MLNWKRTVLVSLFVGIGFGIGISLVVAGFFWHQSRPKPPRSWNKNIITASYRCVDTEGDSGLIVFYYILQNNSEYDYKLSKSDNVELFVKANDGLISESTAEKEITKASLPIWIPAKQRLQFGIHSGIPYTKSISHDLPIEEIKKGRKELEAFLNRNFQRIAGFSLFDQDSRYQIDLPKGW